MLSEEIDYKDFYGIARRNVAAQQEAGENKQNVNRQSLQRKFSA
jgi:hypothetical protein